MPLKWIPPFSPPQENVPLILTLFRIKIVDSATVVVSFPAAQTGVTQAS